MKILNLILKINLTNENVEEKLKILAQSILDDIFMNDNNKKIRNEMLQDGLQLATIILKYLSNFNRTTSSYCERIVLF